MAYSSVYRDLRSQLDHTDGHTAHWPILLRQLLTAEFGRQQPHLIEYSRTVSIRRMDSSWEHLEKAEDREARRLYKTCEDSTHSILTIGDEPFLFLGWQWPNQDSEKGRRADLVGLNREGGIVVFEAKLGSNGDSPLMAMLEGLDYLVHFVLEANFSQIAADYETRTRKASGDRPFPPSIFAATKPSLRAVQDVIVLAPAEYYTTHTNSGKTSGRGHGWREFAGKASADPFTLRFRYAETDFTGTTAKWL